MEKLDDKWLNKYNESLLEYLKELERHIKIENYGKNIKQSV